MALGDRAVVIVQDPIRLFPQSEPQPDIVLAKPPDDRYVDHHPDAADVLLVVEVAHTTQRFDRETKVPLYARYNIPEVWIVDIAARSVEVYRTPESDRYIGIQSFGRGKVISPLAFPDLRVEVGLVLPST